MWEKCRICPCLQPLAGATMTGAERHRRAEAGPREGTGRASPPPRLEARIERPLLHASPSTTGSTAGSAPPRPAPSPPLLPPAPHRWRHDCSAAPGKQSRRTQQANHASRVRGPTCGGLWRSRTTRTRRPRQLFPPAMALAPARTNRGRGRERERKGD